jgi:hypothetical protein
MPRTSVCRNRGGTKAEVGESLRGERGHAVADGSRVQPRGEMLVLIVALAIGVATR